MQDCSVWIGQLDNEAFGQSLSIRPNIAPDHLSHLTDLVVGYEPINVLAKRIYECHGPSGPNRVSLHPRLHSDSRRCPAADDTGIRLQASRECP